MAQDDFQGGRSLPFNFGPSFDLLNVIIWTSPPIGGATSKLLHEGQAAHRLTSKN